MRILDRYITATFLSSLGLVLFFVLGLFAVVTFFHMVDPLLDFGEELAARGYTVYGVILRYYLVSIPFILLRVLPFVVLIAATVAVVRLLRGNEIVPMVAAGWSPGRIAAPIFVCAGLISVLMLALQQWGVPRLADARVRLDWFTRGNFEGEFEGITPITDGAGNMWFLDRYRPVEGVMEGVRSLRYREPGTRALLGTVFADRADWREGGPAGPGWYPTRAVLLPAGKEDFGRVQALPSDRPLGTDLLPDGVAMELMRKTQEAGRLQSITEAARRARLFPDVPRQQVAFHLLLTWPLVGVVLLLLGLPFVFRLGERNLYVAIGIALALCASYFAVDALLLDLGRQGSLPPGVAAWLTPLLFTSLGLGLRSS